MGGIVSSLIGGDATAEAAEMGPSESRVLVFHSSNRWQLHFNNLKDSNQLLVVNFTASWCGPCKMIAPAIDAMANNFTDVHFAKIDVDHLQDVSQEFSVQAMPTFVLLKQGKEVDRIVGAKKDELEKKIAKHRS
ncbi:hypothetical protein KSS87_019784 [Heliosperma pusillum]|nr:hypothetical protein KSS87_019784 [Heliosperma pusillum]